MKRIVSALFLALAIVSFAQSAWFADSPLPSGYVTCNDAVSCGDAWIARYFTGLNCVGTSSDKATYVKLIENAIAPSALIGNQSECQNMSSVESIRGKCDAQGWHAETYLESSSCNSTVSASLGGFALPGVCHNLEGDQSFVIFCSYADAQLSPSYSVPNHTIEGTKPLTSFPDWCTISIPDETVLEAECVPFARKKIFSEPSCQGYSTYDIPYHHSGKGAKFDECYNAGFANVKYTCNETTLTQSIYYGDCDNTPVFYREYLPLNVCVPSDDGQKSAIYLCMKQRMVPSNFGTVSGISLAMAMVMILMAMAISM